MNVLRLLAAAAILTLGTTLPAAAVQGQAPTTSSYEATITPDWHGAGAIEGKLTLTIDADGIVNGYFRPDGSIRLSDVTGGLTGDRMWLNLGLPGLDHIDGIFDGRKIYGGTYVNGQTYTFSAMPQIAS